MLVRSGNTSRRIRLTCLTCELACGEFFSRAVLVFSLFCQRTRPFIPSIQFIGGYFFPGGYFFSRLEIQLKPRKSLFFNEIR